MKNKAFNSSHRFGKWMRKYHLGRSMIEMLGVLAIIGVLSVGGLYAYRQAMMSYRINQVTNALYKIHLAVGELCWNAPDCPLVNVTNAGGHLFNTTAICNILNKDTEVCGGVGGWNYQKFPGLENAAWTVNFTSQTKKGTSIGIRGLPKEICEALINKKWSSISAIYINNKGGNLVNGELIPEKKTEMLPLCETMQDDWGIALNFNRTL